MVLQLAVMPYGRIRSHYRDGRPGFPQRMAFMHPAAHGAFLRMLEESAGQIPLTDMWRSSAASLRASRRSKLAKPPAHSGHNYGLSIDVDISDALHRMRMTKKELDGFMQKHGFYCHRKDHRRKAEEWHYNYLGIAEGPERWLKHTAWSFRTSGAIEAVIKHLYEPFWSQTVALQQTYLRLLGHYYGQIDGISGKLTERATRDFQRIWGLKPDAIIGPKTGRLLAFRYAELTSPHVKDLETVRL